MGDITLDASIDIYRGDVLLVCPCISLCPLSKLWMLLQFHEHIVGGTVELELWRNKGRTSLIDSINASQAAHSHSCPCP